MLYDGIFFVNHALKVKQLSVYNDEERFKQTIETLDSIDKHCPNNQVFIFDSSPDRPNIEYIQELNDRGAIFFYAGEEPEVRRFSLSGYRSVAETISFMMFLSWFKSQNYTSKRIYKLSGRYHLNDNFILDDLSYKDSFVFAKAKDTWQKPHIQQLIGINKLYPLRLWHMDYSLLDTFTNTVPQILRDCCDCNGVSIDVEHSYYKNLHTYKTIELDMIGVSGNTAPDGAYIDE